MEVGNGMMFAANVVDGLVHQLGGNGLQHACQRALSTVDQQRLQEGDAIATPVAGKLTTETKYQFIVHTVPPFYNHPVSNPSKRNPNHEDSMATNAATQDDNRKDNIHKLSESLLAQSYRSALVVASTLRSKIQHDISNDNDSRNLRVVTPLLGAGCRGFPLPVAITVAARTLMDKDWANTMIITENDSNHRTENMTVAFAIPNGEVRKQLVEALDRESDPYSSSSS
jgi:O-acetyl-ADP-ribose deacetylase (regulator of RNase III)